MMAPKGKMFQVDTRPTKHVVVSSLTRDATVQACIFDLIDNSIDAARDAIFAAASPEDLHILPASYSGYEINLEFSGSRFLISDNCGGISKEHLASMVLRFGETSAHELGIGVFGVGLNRALFKIGEHSQLKTDTGTQRAEMTLDVQAYLASDDDWNLPARELASSGKPGTQVEITKLPTQISKDFADREWVEGLISEIGTRYGQFIHKGLAITVDGVIIDAHITAIRSNSPFPGEYKLFKAGDGVSVHIEYGQLEAHRFSNEIGYDKAINAQITNEYGWTVICNDRVILMADRSLKTGWETGFHTEFYGFAGIASFEATDPANLPWNTTKTDVDLNNPAYQLALIDMRRFAAKWRSTVEQRKKGSAKGEKIGELPPLAPAVKPPAGGRPKVSKPETGHVKKSPVVKKPDHHQYRSLLPIDINELHCADKLLALVHEAQRVDIFRDPYSSLALLRMLFESAGVEFCRRLGKADEVREFAVDARLKKGHTMTDAQKREAYPSMDELLAFLLQDAAVWGATKGPLKHSLDKMKAHQKQLNGVLHNPFQQVPQHLAVSVRDEVTPILRHLIEASPP
jgi:hypothetical protein